MLSVQEKHARRLEVRYVKTYMNTKAFVLHIQTVFTKQLFTI